MLAVDPTPLGSKNPHATGNPGCCATLGFGMRPLWGRFLLVVANRISDVERLLVATLFLAKTTLAFDVIGIAVRIQRRTIKYIAGTQRETGPADLRAAHQPAIDHLAVFRARLVEHRR